MKKSEIETKENQIEKEKYDKTQAIKLAQIEEAKNKKISLNADETLEVQIINKFLGGYKRKKEEKKAIAEANKKASIERYNPQINIGLTKELIDIRKSQGMVNVTPKKYTNSVGKIIFTNFVTYFNILMVAIAILMLTLSNARLSDYMFGVVVFANLIIGTAQQIYSKHVTDKLKIIVASKTKVIRDGETEVIDSSQIVLDDIIVLSSGDQVPVDAIVKGGSVEVNESLQTGEAKSIKKNEGDYLLAGSFIVSGQAKCKVESVGEDTFAGRLALQAKKVKKNTSVLYRTIYSYITIVSFIVIPLGVWVGFNNYYVNIQDMGIRFASEFEALKDAITKTSASVIGMIPSGLVLLTSIALSVGVIKLAKKKTLVQDIYSIERLARVNCICFDKTGTLTDGFLKFEEQLVFDNSIDLNELMGNYLASQESTANKTSLALKERFGLDNSYNVTKTIPFSSERKYSLTSFDKQGSFALGAPEYLCDFVPLDIKKRMDKYSEEGYRVIALIRGNDIKNEALSGKKQLIAVFILSDRVRENASETIKWFIDNKVDIKVISGDSPLTVSKIAQKAGIPNAENYISLAELTLEEVQDAADKYTVFGRVTPEQKAIIIKTLKNKGKTVAMTGDGINDILAMRQADCAVAMANGSEATRSAAHVILLNSDFSTMPDVCREGRRVVNNVQSSASVFIMKSLFVISLTLLINLFNLFGYKVAYPFTPRSLFIIEMIPLGLDAFLIGLQPNNKEIRGNFMKQVIARALPTALCMTVSVIVFVSFQEKNLFQYSASQSEIINSYLTLMVLTIDTIAFILLFITCLPFNLYRSVVYFGSLILALGIFFLDKSHAFTNIDLSLMNASQWYSYAVAISTSALVLGSIFYMLHHREIKIYGPNKKEER